MADFISARTESSSGGDYVNRFEVKLFLKQGEDDGDPSMPPNLEHQISKGNLVLLAKG